MTCEATREGLVELVVALSGYHEEGIPLFPTIFICDDLEGMIRLLQGREAIEIGEGPRSRETPRLALKLCAPLAQGGWAIYILRLAASFRFGVFRVASLPLAIDPRDTLVNPSLPIIMAVQLAENVVELRGSNGGCIQFHLSDARPDQTSSLGALDDLVQAITAGVVAHHQEAAAVFLRRTLFEILQHPHGTLVAVFSAGLADVPDSLRDGRVIRPAVDIVGRIVDFKMNDNAETVAALQSIGWLLNGMLSSDGITIFSPDARIMAYNVFIRHPVADSAGRNVTGFARRRTFDALCGLLGKELSAAFYRSTDGTTECKRRQT